MREAGVSGDYIILLSGKCKATITTMFGFQGISAA